MQSSLKQLSKDFNKQSDYIIYGKSVNQKELSLTKIYQKDWSGKVLRKSIVITGAHHGWEYLNIADRLANYFLTTKDKVITHFLSQGGIIYVAPIINADGYTNWRRYNANNFDLNRDYPLPIVGHKGLSQPEIKSFLKYLLEDIKKEKAKIVLNINYHCCGPKSDGLLLYPWAHKNAGSQLENKFVTIGEEVKKIFIHKEIQAGQWGRELYLRNGTATDYFYSVHKALAFNFEGSWGKENQRFEQHTEMIKYFIKSLK